MTEHTKISYLKSTIRIAGYGALAVSLRAGVFILILSEFIGILEEWVL